MSLLLASLYELAGMVHIVLPGDDCRRYFGFGIILNWHKGVVVCLLPCGNVAMQ
jgi:hypothetical protein